MSNGREVLALKGILTTMLVVLFLVCDTLPHVLEVGRGFRKSCSLSLCLQVCILFPRRKNASNGRQSIHLDGSKDMMKIKWFLNLTVFINSFVKKSVISSLPFTSFKFYPEALILQGSWMQGKEEAYKKGSSLRAGDLVCLVHHFILTGLMTFHKHLWNH